MRKVISAVLLLAGLVLAGLAYSSYSEYAAASNLARFHRTHPDEVPAGESREQFIAGELLTADRNRHLAILSGAGGLLLCAGGAAVFMRGRRGDVVNTAPAGGRQNVASEARSEAINRWASVALARPVKVQYSRLYTALFAFIIVFLGGLSLLMVVANGFTGTSVLMLVLNGVMLAALYYILSRARRRAACLFDLSGVTRGDNRRFSWSEFKGVDYLMAVRPRSGREYLWRVELTFTGGEAWIIPGRVKNLAEINDLVATLPGAHQKRRA